MNDISFQGMAMLTMHVLGDPAYWQLKASIYGFLTSRSNRIILSIYLKVYITPL